MGLQKRILNFEGKEYPHYYLCTYLPKYRGDDLLSRSLIHFKNSDTPHNHAWVDCAVTELNKVRVLKYCHVIRVPGHAEVTATRSDSAIGHLSSQVSNILKATYPSNFLEKLRETRKFGGSHLTREERELEVKDLFRFTPAGKTRHILIVDDILTTGATVKAIMKAVLKVLPEIKVSVFTLAHTDYDSTLNSEVNLKGKQYYWDREQRWMVAAEDSPEYATTLATLKTYIMNDSFPG